MVKTTKKHIFFYAFFIKTFVRLYYFLYKGIYKKQTVYIKLVSAKLSDNNVVFNTT